MLSTSDAHIRSDYIQTKPVGQKEKERVKAVEWPGGTYSLAHSQIKFFIAHRYFPHIGEEKNKP